MIVRAEGREIETAGDLINAVGLRSVGEEISLEIVDRDGRTKTVRAVLGAMVSAVGEDIHPGLVGAELVDWAEGQMEGVRVESVAANSPAARIRLQADDLIVGVNRQRVHSVEEMRELARDRSLLVLNIRRGNRRVVLTVRS